MSDKLSSDARQLLNLALSDEGVQPSDDDKARVGTAIRAAVAAGAAGGALSAASAAAHAGAAGTTGAAAGSATAAGGAAVAGTAGAAATAAGVGAVGGAALKGFAALALLGGLVTATVTMGPGADTEVSESAAAEAAPTNALEQADQADQADQANQAIPSDETAGVDTAPALAQTTASPQAPPTASAPALPTACPSVNTSAPPARPTTPEPAATNTESNERPAEPSSPSVSLGDELALLRAAQSARAAGRPQDALRELELHRTRFPEGALRAEREGSYVLALCDAGRAAEARAAAGRFLDSYPASPLAQRVASACR